MAPFGRAAVLQPEVWIRLDELHRLVSKAERPAIQGVEIVEALLSGCLSDMDDGGYSLLEKAGVIGFG